MVRPVSSKRARMDFITGLLLGFLITFFVLFILTPMFLPKPAVAPTDSYGYVN